MTKLNVIEGIGEVYMEKLEAAGIGSVEELLDFCRTKKGRTELAEKAEISEKLILTWANHADLFRIKGVQSQYADLLEEAGVDTVPELATRNAGNLFKAIMDINEEKKLVRKPPSIKQVEDWIAQAKELPRMLEY